MKKIFVLFFLAFNYCNAQDCDDYLLKFEDFNLKGDYRNAILFGQLVVDSCDGIGNLDTYKNSLIKLGIVYKKSGYYFNAEKCYFKALEVLKKEKGEKSLQFAFLQDNLGNLYTVSKEFKKAKKCYAKSSILISNLLGKNSKDYQIHLGNLANFYTQTKKYKDAERTYVEIFEIQKKINDNDFDIAIGYDNYGSFLETKGDYLNAIKYKENALQLFEKTVGFFHPDYFIALQNLILLYNKTGDTLKLKDNLENAVEISKITYGVSSEEYNLIKTRLIEFYNQTGMLKKLPDFYLEDIKIFTVKFGKKSNEIIERKIQLADCYFKLEEFKKAENVFLEVKNTLNELNQQNSLSYLICVSALSKVYKLNSLYEKAIQYQLESSNISKVIFGMESEEYVSSIIELSYLQNELFDFGNQEKNLLLAIKLSEKKFVKNYIIATHNLAEIYRRKGENNRAEELFFNALTKKEKIYGKNSIEYSNTLNSLVVTYLESNQFEKIEKILIQISEIYKKNLKIKDKRWIDLYSNFASYYEQIFNEKKASHYYYLIEKNISCLDSLDQAYYRSILGNFFSNSNKLEKAILAYETNLDYYKSKFGESHYETAIALFNLGTLFYDIKKYKDAEKYIGTALEILTSKKEFKDSNTMKQLGVTCRPIIELLAKCFLKNGEKQLANIAFIKSISLNKRIFGEHSLYYSKSLFNYASFLERFDTTSNIKIADSLICVSEKIGLQNLKTQLSLFSNPASFNILKQDENKISLAYSFLNRNNTPNLTEVLLDYDLFIKNVLLAKNNIITGLNKKNLDFKQNALLENYKKLNIVVTNYYQKFNNDSLSFSNLIDSSEKLENELIESIPQLKYAIKERNIKWSDISKKLKKNEIAIDYINFKYNNAENVTDTTIYAAFVIQPDLKQPKYIKLFYENELLDLISHNNSVNEIYNEPTLSLYSLIVKPLDSLLNGVKKIYISPSGLLHRISFSGISTFENKKLLEKYEIETLSNLTSIINEKKSPANINSLCLFGDIDYDNEPTVFKNYIINDDSALSFSRSLMNGKWRRLISTGAEIKYISILSDSLGINSIIYNGQEASEENFKSIKSPTVLHIATHGISAPISNLQPNEKRNNYSIELVKKTPVFSRSEDPLTRSALILAGANRFWLHGETYPNHDDGILTAREVSNLDLNNCELATLSACETGLGDIKGSEGVYGLQRAFKMAGVHYLIVSLWKVPDAETADFMQTFYSKWLKDKNEIKDAFRKTQLEMSDKYKEPYKWAGFTLIE